MRKALLASVHRHPSGPPRLREVHGGHAVPEDALLRLPRQDHQGVEPRDLLLLQDALWAHQCLGKLQIDHNLLQNKINYKQSFNERGLLNGSK